MDVYCQTGLSYNHISDIGRHLSESKLEEITTTKYVENISPIEQRADMIRQTTLSLPNIGMEAEMYVKFIENIGFESLSRCGKYLFNLLKI